VLKAEIISALGATAFGRRFRFGLNIAAADSMAGNS
jgi:hypothetical protein